jgi:hypothetical protein
VSDAVRSRCRRTALCRASRSLVNVQVSLISPAGLTAVVNLRVLDEAVRVPCDCGNRALHLRNLPLVWSGLSGLACCRSASIAWTQLR